MTMTRCVATSNGNAGVRAYTSATIYVSDSTITANGAGILPASGGVVTSRGNNTLQGNTANGTFTSNFPAN
jgi:parallel beta helix pectate lyase-like protein